MAGFMLAVAGVSDLSGLSPWLVRGFGAAGLTGGLLVAFATVWLPIAVIDFRRCTRETSLRSRVEADLACHAAEAEGRRRHRAELTSRCEAVLDGGGPTIVYQPIVEVSAGAVVGYEALSRFADGVAPDRWFAQAAEVGLGVEMELAAVRRALAGLSGLPGSPYLSVNASPEALCDPRLPELIAAGCPSRVVVELTEHVPLGNYERYRQAIGTLREMGSRVAVDDAGAGYSSLRHVVDLQPDMIKIDRSLVHAVHLEPARRSLLIAFVSFASDLGATLVAEGVEEPLEEEVLRQWGLRFAQGWLYGRPMPLEVLSAARGTRPLYVSA
ncbi:MAG TPA: EAL domain-containing protein [Acidimicrobiales bacterium]|nr:EAL domain-containing protein [Acidimicrobiales bacterium]